MKKEEKASNCFKEKATSKNHRCNNRSEPGTIYGLGVVGALFYFLQNATTLWLIIVGIGKAIFWPAILMFKLLTYLQM